MPPFTAPLAVAGSVAVSRHDALERGDDSLHLEQVDTQRSLRKLGVFNELLRRVVRHHVAAARVTLCVLETNPARFAYEAVGFTCARQEEGLCTYVLDSDRLRDLRAGVGSCLAAAAPHGIHFSDPALGGARALDQDAMHTACGAVGQSSPSEQGAVCQLVRSLCVENLPEYQTGPLTEEEANNTALHLLTGTGEHATGGDVTYLVALLPRAELDRATARLGLHEAADTRSTDKQVRAAITLWQSANTAADFEKAAAARLLREADNQQTKQRRVYHVRFWAALLACGYVGHETQSNQSTRASEHVLRKGSAWTATYTNNLQEADFQLTVWRDWDKQAALVAELVTLMQLAALHQGHEWRGGPFVACDKASWGVEKTALWVALARVVHWPTNVVERLGMLAGIGHLVPGNLLWRYTNDLCFTCGWQGHYSNDCAKVQAKRKRDKRLRKNPPGGAGAASSTGHGGVEGEAEPADEPDDEASQASADQSGMVNEDEAPAPHAAPTAPAPIALPAPHVLWSSVSQREASRAANQASAQRFPLPDGLASGNLTAGYAIAACPDGGKGGGLRGKDFALRCVLARTHCINTGGAASDAILYDINGSAGKNGAMRALLSPRGVRAFYAVVFAVKTEKLAELRAASTSANANRLPVELIRSLRCGGLERSIDSGMPLPKVDACSQAVLEAWWKMQLAGVAALASTEKLVAWNATCQAFEAARRAP